MKLTVAKEDLLNALKGVSACKSNTGTDLSSHFLFKVVPDPAKSELRVDVAAYSGQTFASSPIKGVTVEGDDADAFTIEGWRLEKCLAALPDEGKPLTLTYVPSVKKSVEVRVAKGAQSFDSLDPAKFPSWDGVIAKSVMTASLPAPLLLSVLNYAKDFVGSDETKHPEQTVLECRRGVVYAMDGQHAVQIRCPALKDCTLRIHQKDLSGILSFLGTLKDDVVELLEDQQPNAEPTTLVLRRHRVKDSDPTSIYGENRFTMAFPDLGAPEPTDHYLWALPKEGVLEALPVLECGAVKGDTKLRLNRDAGSVTFSMKKPSGEWSLWDMSVSAPVVASNAPAFPAEGFMVNKDSFESAMKSMPGDNPSIGVNKLGRGGYLRFIREEGPNGEAVIDGKSPDGKPVEEKDRTLYLTVVAWVK